MNDTTASGRTDTTRHPGSTHRVAAPIISSCIAAAAICALVFWSRYTALPGSTATAAARILLSLCDGTFVAGALLCCAGLLVVVTNEGAFTAATWGFSRLFCRLRKSGDRHSNLHSSSASAEASTDEPERRAPGSMSYFEYVQECKKKKHTAAHLFIVGGVFLVLSLILLIFITVQHNHSI